MSTQQLLRGVFWIVLLVTVFLFFAGLRAGEDALEYTLYALPGLGLCYLLDWRIKALNRKADNEE